MASKYNHIEIQEKWDKVWKDAKIYQPDLDSAKNPFYHLMMFPYPSAEGLHVGNMYAFTGADVYGRFKRMQGNDVFEPIGLDGFGIHSENYALKIGAHPALQAKISEKRFYEQLRLIGNGFDWTRTVETYKPDYYKWTQWLFIQLFKAGLAEKRRAMVNWCPSCKTVLADEQVLSGLCERCGSQVEKKELEQWFFKITDYADRLLEGLDRIDWTPKVKLAQRNWIGRKEGINIEYEVEGLSDKIVVFTTRPDTNFGATFIALAPEHPLAMKLSTSENKNKVSKYIEEAKNKTDQERMEEGREKTGEFAGSYAINNLTKEKMPVWVSDFVLMGFGTGAIVGVPGHDKRDFQFAKKFDIPIKRVVIGRDKDRSEIISEDQVQEDEGTMVNSDFLDGLDIYKATVKIMDFMEEKGFGKRKTTYHLRDWLISRQRYWGAPIPMVYCQSCADRGVSYSSTKAEGRMEKLVLDSASPRSNNKMKGWFPVPEKDLPVLLPYIENFKPLGIHSARSGISGQAGSGQAGVGPLAQDEKFVNTTCPVCGGPAKRETDVADTFLDSSWYFLRYPSASSGQVPFEPELTKKWLPVDMYIGGAEHSVLHLLYSRFVTKALFDQKLLDFDEPFTKFRAHGLLIKDGAKMSKSKGNVVNPDEYIDKYGADTLRTYLMFLGPYEAGGDFRDSGIEGMERFLKKVRKLVEKMVLGTKNQSERQSAKDSPLKKSINRAIKGVGNDIESLRYNTAIAKIMELVNDLNASKENISIDDLKKLVLLLSPFAPYLTEEMWEFIHTRGPVSLYPRPTSSPAAASAGARRGSPALTTPRESAISHQPSAISSVHSQPWPSFDESALVEDTVKIAVQINGKLRELLIVDSSKLKIKSYVEDEAKKSTKVQVYIKDKEIKKVIYVEGKIINFVV